MSPTPSEAITALFLGFWGYETKMKDIYYSCVAI